MKKKTLTLTLLFLLTMSACSSEITTPSSSEALTPHSAPSNSSFPYSSGSPSNSSSSPPVQPNPPVDSTPTPPTAPDSSSSGQPGPADPVTWQEENPKIHSELEKFFTRTSVDVATLPYLYVAELRGKWNVFPQKDSLLVYPDYNEGDIRYDHDRFYEAYALKLTESQYQRDNNQPALKVYVKGQAKITLLSTELQIIFQKQGL